MAKRFGITLIVLSTILYGSIFFLSIQYGTDFFDEILAQANRIAISFSKKPEIQQSKLVLKAILENEHPPENWNNLIVHNQQNDHKELFYYYKIWTIKTKLTLETINSSYPIFKSERSNITFINMRYGKTNPVVQFPFSKGKTGSPITGLFFPLNQRSMAVDFNKDDTVNHKDVLIARAREKKTI
jgi:hypothetical protein